MNLLNNVENLELDSVQMNEEKVCRLTLKEDPKTADQHGACAPRCLEENKVTVR